MHTHFGMKTYLTIQESGGERNKQGGGMMEGRAMGGGNNLKSHSWGGTGSKERIEAMGGRIGWREI